MSLAFYAEIYSTLQLCRLRPRSCEGTERDTPHEGVWSKVYRCGACLYTPQYAVTG
jgi:hypothetical protein